MSSDWPLDQIMAQAAFDAEEDRERREADPEWQAAVMEDNLALLGYIRLLELAQNETAKSFETDRYLG